jgi:hypothetical protein
MTARPAKIALLLPPEADWRWLWRAQAFREVIEALGRRQDVGPLDLIVGIPDECRASWDHAVAIDSAARPFKTRHLRWDYVPHAQVEQVYPDLIPLPGVDQLAVPRDGGWNFADCDLWIVAGDHRIGGVAQLRPTIFYCRDIATRYEPDTMPSDHAHGAWRRQLDSFLSWRGALGVITAHAHTAGDLNSYAGVRRASIFLAPPLWATLASPAPQRPLGPSDALVWFTEPGPEYNNGEVIDALSDYMERGGRRPIIVASQNPDQFNPRRGAVTPFKSALSANLELLTRVSFAKIRSLEDVGELLTPGRAVLYSRSFDGEPEFAAWSLERGLPIACLRTPYTEDLASRGPSAFLYERGSPRHISQALSRLESTASPVERRVDDPAESRERFAAALFDIAAEVLSR